MVTTAIFKSVLHYRRVKRERIPSTISEDQQGLQVLGCFSSTGSGELDLSTYISKERDEPLSLLFPSRQSTRVTKDGVAMMIPE
jgi:hypothetical protein